MRKGFFNSHRSLFLFGNWQYVSIRAGWIPDVLQPVVSGINDLHDLWGHMVSLGPTELTMLVKWAPDGRLIRLTTDYK